MSNRSSDAAAAPTRAAVPASPTVDRTAVAMSQTKISTTRQETESSTLANQDGISDHNGAEEEEELDEEAEEDRCGQAIPCHRVSIANSRSNNDCLQRILMLASANGAALTQLSERFNHLHSRLAQLENVMHQNIPSNTGHAGAPHLHKSNHSHGG